MYRFLAEVHDAILLRKNHDFGANPGKEKESSQPHRASRRLPAVLPPVGRCVASQGGGGVRIPPGPFGRVLGSFSVRRKRSSRLCFCQGESSGFSVVRLNNHAFFRSLQERNEYASQALGCAFECGCRFQGLILGFGCVRCCREYNTAYYPAERRR